MPSWLFKRRPSPPPPKAPVVRAEDLSQRLMDAIIRRDMGAARHVFDQAFWDKVGFRPDGYHLLQAVKRGDREMTRLVLTHGAGWNAEETKIARLLAGPDRWSEAAPELRRAGLRTEFTTTELQEIDLVAATAWARRCVQHEERRGAPEAAQSRRDLDTLVGTGIVLCVVKGDMEQAVRLLRTNDAQDGSAARPFEIGPVFGALIKAAPQEMDKALRFLDTLRVKRLAVKPITLTGSALWLHPQLAQELDRRKLLSDSQLQTRMNLLHNWSVVQTVIDVGAGPIHLDEKYVATQHAALQKVAQVLFRADRPVTTEEAEFFVSMHDARLRQTPEALARMENELMSMGFFKSPAFSVAQLRHLAQTAPGGPNAGRDGLAAGFNRLASRRLFSETRAEKFLNAARFPELEEAHRLRAWRANAEQAAKILDYLATRVKKDVVPDDVVSALKTLRDGGADFSRVNPNRYLGKKAPGLCKTLLDLGIVSASRIDIEQIAKRHDNELRPLTPKNAAEHADQEFMCQVVLELMDPGKYVAMRGQPEVDYQRQLIRECTLRRAFKMKFIRRTSSTGPR